MYHSFLIHSSADGPLGCFYVLAIINSAVMKLGYMCLFQFWFLWCVCPAVGLLGLVAVLFPVFWRISTLFSIVAVLVCFPTNSVRGFPFLCTLSSVNILLVDFWIAAILTSVQWYLIVVLICISLVMIDAELFFMCLLAVCLLWRNVCLILCPFFDWVIYFSGIELHELFVYFWD